MISLKKDTDAMNKNSEINGLNMKLPTGESQEEGSPHATIIGSETSVKKICRLT